MQAMDWVLFIAVISLGIYSILYSERPELMAFLTLFGLFLVARFGNFIRQKIARSKVDLQIESKRHGKKLN